MVDIAIFGITQRSGSTLVQRLFNANPDTIVWGENGRVLELLAAARANAIDFSEFHAASRDCFFTENRPLDLNVSCMSPELPAVRNAFIAGTSSLLTTLYPRAGCDRVGFKEVLQGAAAVKLFQEAFPDAVTILLARHPVPTWRSYDPEWRGLESFIEHWTANLTGYAKLGPILWYERLLRDPATQERLRAMAGITRQQFDAVMDVKVASTAEDFPKSDRDYAVIQARCGGLIPPDIAVPDRMSRVAA